MPTTFQSNAPRWRSLVRLEKSLEPTMIFLGLVWLLLLTVEFVWQTTRLTEWLSNAIWIAFIVEFIVRFWIAPRKRQFLTRNWITIIALGLPAFRILRFGRALRLFRATRGLRLVRLLTSMNRGLSSLRRGMQRRGAGYVAVLTLVVIIAGAAGMLAFEPELRGYGEALWWTAMLVTTLGSDFWPHTTEGRVLTLLLSIYAVGVFGYLAASLASYFVGKESSSNDEAALSRQAAYHLRDEIAQLREELARARSSQG